MKTMGKVIKEFGGSKKIKAMPLEDKLFVMKEVELARRGLPTGPVKVMNEESLNVELMFGCMPITEEKGEALKAFDRLTERIEIFSESELSKSPFKIATKLSAKVSLGIMGIGTAIAIGTSGTSGAIAAGTVLLVASAIVVGSGIKDFLKFNKAVKETVARVKSVSETG